MRRIRAFIKTPSYLPLRGEVKRLVNTYRILKAVCTPLVRERFVLAGGESGEYGAAMTLLALVTGAPPIRMRACLA